MLTGASAGWYLAATERGHLCLRLVVGPVWGQVLAEPPVIFDNYYTYYDTHTHHSQKCL